MVSRQYNRAMRGSEMRSQPVGHALFSSLLGDVGYLGLHPDQLDCHASVNSMDLAARQMRRQEMLMRFNAFVQQRTISREELGARLKKLSMAIDAAKARRALN